MLDGFSSRCLARTIFVIAAYALFGTPPLAFGQQTGQLRVKVVDQSGGSLPHARIVIDGAGSTANVAMTEIVGVFAAQGLVAGHYTLIVSADGFATSTRAIEIKANRVNALTVTLTVHTTETVDVSGLKIGTLNGLTGLTFSGKDLALLPSNEIELLDLLRELAGSRGRPGDLAIYVDGFRDFRRLPPKGAIDVIQINAEPYSAEFPEPGTRRIEIITKPGVEGTFGEFKSDFNDSAMNAREALATNKPDSERRSFSGYFSRPIIPQHWGFYVYAGRWYQDENAVIHATTLNDALEPTLFQQTLSAPQRLDSFTANTGLALGKGTRIKLEFSRDATTASNQGLTSGFDLPERGISSKNTVNTGRFSLLSVLGSSAVYEMRVQVSKTLSQTRAASGGTAILVLDAFNEGANQAALYDDTSNDTVQFDTKLTKVVGGHNVKIGAQVDRINLSRVDYNNFGGTFTFGADVDRNPDGSPILSDTGSTIPISPLESYRRTVLGLPGYRPTLFTVTLGDPSAGVRQWQYAGYAQDDWIPSKNFTLSTGFRYEGQTNLRDRLDLAPRIGLAWSLGENGGVIRAGSGLFYKRFDPSLTLNTVQYDGQRQTQYVVQDPSFSPPPTLDQDASRQVIMTKAGDLDAGRELEANVGDERTLFGPFFGSATYTWDHGDHQTILDDVNAPLTPGGVRPIAGVGQVLQYQSGGRSRHQELQLGLRASFKSNSRLFINYTLGSSESNTDDDLTLPANPRSFSNEWGPSSTDERHRVFINGTVMLPRYIMVIPSFTFATPPPFNITTGLDNNLDGHLTDRPSIASPGDVGAIATPFGLLNPFPKAGETIIGRNSARGSRLLKFDLSLAKVFVIGDPKEAARTFSLHVDFQNLLNTTNLRDYNGVLLSPVFGQANTADPARRVSVGMGFTF